MRFWTSLSGTMERTMSLLGRYALGPRGAAVTEGTPMHPGAWDASHNAGVGSSSLPPATCYSVRLKRLT